MNKKNEGFMMVDILFSLFIIGISSILLVYVFNNNINYMGKNKIMAELRLDTQNFIDELNYEKDSIYLDELLGKNSIEVNRDESIIYIKKEAVGDSLWKLYIKSIYKKDKEIMASWVIVIERP